MKYLCVFRIPLVCCSLLLSACDSIPTDLLGTQELRGYAVQKGTLANKKLANDTLYGVAAEVSNRGCDKMQSVEPYVVEMPYGSPGSRTWSELWVVKGCEAVYDVEIMFDEVGLSAADYTIM